MILELKRLEGDYELYDSDLDDSFFINTKNIYSIEYFQDKDYRGLLINSNKYPLYEYTQAERVARQAKNEAEKEELMTEDWEKAKEYIDNILNKIIEIMKSEQ